MNIGKVRIAVALLSVMLDSGFVMAQDPIVPLKVTLVREDPFDMLNGTVGVARFYKTELFLSGDSKNFSYWYTMTSPEAPAGYKYWSSTFTTKGDRQCGGGDSYAYVIHKAPVLTFQSPAGVGEQYRLAQDYAECYVSARDSTHVTWVFRTKGHLDRVNSFLINAESGKGVTLGFDTKYDHHRGVSEGTMYVVYVPIEATKK